jgi:N-hydroxyarylamine O-acetyltransferase
MMAESPFPLQAYLQRIGYTDVPATTPQALCALQRAQVQSIPFENLDIFLARPILLDPASLVRKLIADRRGGYCYELNGLFLLALRQLGFDITPLAARVLRDGRLLQKSHQLLLVTCQGERWIADAGFGGNGLIEAIPLAPGREHDQHLDTFRLLTDARLGFVLQHRLAHAWHGLYAFTLEEYYPADFEMMNYFSSTSPASFFTRQPLCIVTRPDARVLLSGNELNIRRPGETLSSLIEGEAAYRQTLQREAGITLPAGVTLRYP